MLDGRCSLLLRPVKYQPHLSRTRDDCSVRINGQRHSGPPNYLVRHILPRHGCPWGKVGGGLWIKEPMSAQAPNGLGSWFYDADLTYLRCAVDDPRFDAVKQWLWAQQHSRCAAYRMPRWAARFTATITDITVVRTMDLTEVQAEATGVTPMLWADIDPDGERRRTESIAYRAGLSDIWASKGRSFEDNPWVFAIAVAIHYHNRTVRHG